MGFRCENGYLSVNWPREINIRGPNMKYVIKTNVDINLRTVSMVAGPDIWGTQ